MCVCLFSQLCFQPDNVTSFGILFRPPPYEFPSKDAVGTSTYRSYFQTSVDPKEMTQPTSAGRKNNPHPRGMTNAFNFPNRVSSPHGTESLRQNKSFALTIKRPES